MINFHIYWYYVGIKVFFKRKLAALHNYYQERFKRHCTCPYQIKADKAEVWCEKCRAFQKHSRWK